MRYWRTSVSPENFSNFPPIFKNNCAGTNDIEPPMEADAKKNGALFQPRRMPILSYFMENGTIIKPFFFSF